MDHKPGEVFTPGSSKSRPDSPPAKPTGPSQVSINQTPSASQSQTAPSVPSPNAGTLSNQNPTFGAGEASIGEANLKPKRKGLKVLVISVLFLLIVGGAGAYAYLGVYLPNTPENMVKAAFASLLTSESGKVRAEVNVQSGPISVTPVIEFEAGSEKMSLNMSFKDWAEGVNLEFRVIDQDGYIKVEGLSGLFESEDVPLDPFSAAILGGFSVYEGQWIKFDSNEFIGVTTSDIAEIDIQALAERELFTISETLADEDIEGRSAKHFKVEFNTEAIKTAVSELDASLDEQWKETLSSLADASAGRQVDIWVYKDTKELAQFLFDTDVDGTSISGKITIISLNQPVDVIAPESAKTFEEITADLEEEFFNDLAPLDGLSNFELEFDNSDFSEFESI